MGLAANDMMGYDWVCWGIDAIYFMDAKGMEWDVVADILGYLITNSRMHLYTS